MFTKFSPLAAALVAAAVIVSGVAAPANAAVLERYSLDYSDAGVADDFCGSGLQPTFTYEQSGSGVLRTRGDGLWLWLHEKLRIVRTFTLNGMTVTDTQPNTVSRDLKVVDNGDGTLSLTILQAGGNRLVGSDGKLLAKNDGQVRVLVVIDIAAEEVISEEVIFGSTGTNDDFCEAILAHWGV